MKMMDNIHEWGEHEEKTLGQIRTCATTTVKALLLQPAASDSGSATARVPAGRAGTVYEIAQAVVLVVTNGYSPARPSR